MTSCAQDRVPSEREFTAVENHIHFHPDEGLGGFAILVLLRRSALRPAGVHLLDGGSHRWWKAADLDELPSGRWVRLRGEDGAPLPVEVLRTRDEMRVRWLGGGGPAAPAPTPPAVSRAPSRARAKRPSTPR